MPSDKHSERVSPSNHTLLIAPAGYGKTHYCLEQFKKDVLLSPDLTNLKSFYIVPTKEHAERILDLLFRDANMSALGRHQVTTFNEFIDFMMGDGGRDLVTDVLRSLFVADIVAELRMDYFAQVGSRSGFIELISDFVAEVKESEISSEDFCGLLSQKISTQIKGDDVNKHVMQKYEELNSILQAYDKRLAAEGLSDVQDIARLFKKSIHSPAPRIMPKLDHIYMDGFFELTPIQLELLRILCLLTEKVTVTLTADAKHKQNRFEATDKFRSKLKELGFVEVSHLFENNRRTDHEDLRLLEENLFLDSTVAVAMRSVEHIEIIEARSERDEIESIAREIRKQYATGKYHFSDFCLIYRQIGSHGALLESVFEEFNLPCQIHERKMLRLDPVVASIMNLLDVFAGGWKKEAVIRFMHSALASSKRQLVSQIERHIYNSGMTGGRDEWLKNWQELSGEWDGERLAWFRQWVDLENEFRTTTHIAGHVEVMQRLLMKYVFRMPESGGETETPGATRAHALRRFWDVLSELAFSFKRRGGEEVLFEEFYAHLKRTVDVSLFSDTAWGKNRVQVYDISTARQKEYKVVFMCNLLEKNFPRRVGENPILKDRERRWLQNDGRVILEEQLPRQAIERYLFYLGATRARDLLYLSYPQFGIDGTENTVSFYIDDVERALSGNVPVRKRSASDVLVSFEEARTRNELERSAIFKLFENKLGMNPEAVKDRNRDRLLLSLIGRLIGEEKFRSVMQTLYEMEGRFDWHHRKSAHLSDPRALKLLSERKRPYAATRLETYGACPFRYYLSNEVHLNEPDDELSVRSVGNILHHALEMFFEKQGYKLNRGEAIKLMNQALEESIAQEPLISERSYRLELKKLELREILIKFLDYYSEEIKGKELKPYLFEHKFGEGESALEVESEENSEIKTLISGAIDRVDTDGQRRYAVIIDYKLSKSIKRKDFKRGLSLQLPLYILAFEKSNEMKVIGAYLFRLSHLRSDKTLIQGFFSEDRLHEAGFGDKLSPDRKSLGMAHRKAYSEQEFLEIINESEAWASQYAGEIRKGKFPVYPKDCVRYCKFKSVCRIETWMKHRIQFELAESEKEL